MGKNKYFVQSKAYRNGELKNHPINTENEQLLN